MTAGSADRGSGTVLHIWWIGVSCASSWPRRTRNDIRLAGINPVTQIWTDAIGSDPALSDAATETRAAARINAEVTEVMTELQTVRSNAKVNA